MVKRFEREIAIPFGDRTVGTSSAYGYDTAYNPVRVSLAFSKGRAHLTLSMDGRAPMHIILLEPIARQMTEIISSSLDEGLVEEIMDA